MSKASELIYDEVWAMSEAARLTDEQIIKFIYAPNSDNLTKAIRSRLADRIEALERENAALRDDDAKMQLLHRQEDQLIAAERKVAELEADKARLSEALRPFADMADYLDSETEGFADTDEFDLLYEDHLFHHFKVADFRAARAALSGSGSGWRAIETAPNEQEVLIAYWRWRNSMSPGTIVVQSAMRTEFHGPGIWSWVVSDNKHGPFPIRGWCDGDIVGWQPLPAAPQQGDE